MTKMTKIAALTTAIDLVKNYAPDNAELAEKLATMLATEQKRADAPRKKTETKAHKENMAAVDKVVTILTGVTSASAKEIAEQWGEEISIPKMCAILRCGVEDGRIQRLEVGKNIMWALAGSTPETADEDETEEEEGE